MGVENAGKVRLSADGVPVAEARRMKRTALSVFFVAFSAPVLGGCPAPTANSSDLPVGQIGLAVEVMSDGTTLTIGANLSAMGSGDDGVPVLLTGGDQLVAIVEGGTVALSQSVTTPDGNSFGFGTQLPAPTTSVTVTVQFLRNGSAPYVSTGYLAAPFGVTSPFPVLIGEGDVVALSTSPALVDPRATAQVTAVGGCLDQPENVPIEVSNGATETVSVRLAASFGSSNECALQMLVGLDAQGQIDPGFSQGAPASSFQTMQVKTFMTTLHE
jgi:hypothetical protein